MIFTSVESDPPTWYLPLVYNENFENVLTPDADKITNFNRYAVKYCTWLKQLETFPKGRTVSLINPTVFNVVTDKKGRSGIFVNPINFERCDPTEQEGGLTLDNISDRLSLNANPHAQGFGRLLRHVYDSCTVPN